MGRVHRRALQRLHDNGFDLLVPDRAGSAWTWLVDQSSQTPFVEAEPPLADGLWPDTLLGGDFLVGFAVGAAQDDPAGEKAVLDSEAAQAGKQGVNPVFVRRVFEGQIAASKAVRHALFAQ